MPAPSVSIALSTATLCLVAAVGSGAPRSHAVADDSAANFAITTEDTPFGCKVNVSATNKGSRRVAISRDSQVKAGALGAAFGAWTKLGKSVWINPGSTGRWSYDLKLGCENQRNYRFQVKQFDSADRLLGDFWYYYPGQDKYTDDVTLSLGDLNRFF